MENIPIGTIPFFSGLELEELLILMQHTQTLNEPPRTIIFDQGDQPKGLYIIVSGRCRVFVVDGGRPTTIAELGPGDYFGEMSLIDGQPCSASVVSMTEVVLIKLAPEDFERALRTKTTMARKIMRVLCDRIRQLNANTVASRGPRR